MISWRLQAVAAFLLLSAIIAKVYCKIERTRLGYRLGTEKQVAVDLSMERRELELQRSYLYSADTLRSIAEQRLNLLPLKPEQARKIRY